MSAPRSLVVATWPRSARVSVRVQLTTFQGKPVIDVRCWFDAGHGQLKPGRKGLTLGVRHLGALTDALVAAYAEAERLGLVIEEGKLDALQ